jgi:hypothetical protein
MTAKIQAIMISFLSFQHSKKCVNSFQRVFPEQSLVVIDNNPLPENPRWTKECEEEREWLQNKKNLIYIESPTRHIHRGYPSEFNNSNIHIDYYPYNNHGITIDFAVSWCKKNNVEIMLLLEPDCWITNKNWFNQSLERINNGAWVTGEIEQIITYNHLRKKQKWEEYVLQLAGSMWLVNEIDESFQIYPIIDDGHIKKIIDTGQRLFLKHSYKGKSSLLDLNGFNHLWHGSKKETFYEKTKMIKI